MQTATRNKFERLVSKAQLAVYILGNHQSEEYALVAAGEEAAQAQCDLVSRGLRFVGVIAIVDGKVCTALAEEIDDPTMSALSQAFVQIAAAEIIARISTWRRRPSILEAWTKCWSATGPSSKNISRTRSAR